MIVDDLVFERDRFERMCETSDDTTVRRPRRVEVISGPERRRGDQVQMPNEPGEAPRSSWAKMVSELHVNDLDRSLSFWGGVLGFAVAFQRPTERFVYLEHAEEHQIMLCQRHGRFETGALEYPLGQGALFQIYLQSLEPVLAHLRSENWPIYLGPREVWRQVGNREYGQREVFVQDPDGYLLMLAENIGKRSA